MMCMKALASCGLLAYLGHAAGDGWGNLRSVGDGIYSPLSFLDRVGEGQIEPEKTVAGSILPHAAVKTAPIAVSLYPSPQVGGPRR
jgi:hypothetical protein